MKTRDYRMTGMGYKNEHLSNMIYCNQKDLAVMASQRHNISHNKYNDEYFCQKKWSGYLDKVNNIVLRRNKMDK